MQAASLVVVIIIILVLIVFSRGDDDDSDTGVYVVNKTPKADDDVEAQVTEAPKESPKEEDQKEEDQKEEDQQKEHPYASGDPYANSTPGTGIEMRDMSAASD